MGLTDRLFRQLAAATLVRVLLALTAAAGWPDCSLHSAMSSLSLSRRSAAATPLLPLTAIVALTPTQLVDNFPAILDTIQCHHLLCPAPTTSAPSSSPSLHTRLLTKCLGLISQGHRDSNPPEQWCGLQLLSALIRQSAPAALSSHYQPVVATLSELQKQAGYLDDVLDVPLLECMAAVLCSAAEAGGETRRELMTGQLNKTVGIVIDRLTARLPSSSASAPVSATGDSSLLRLLHVLDDLLSVYASSLRSFSSRLQPVLTAVLLHCDDSCLPPLLTSLTTVLVSMTAAANTQQSNKAKQARLQQAAQDTPDELAQHKLAPTATSTPHNHTTTLPATAPYHAYTTACIHQLTTAVNELRTALGEQPLAAVGGGAGGELGWDAVVGEGVMRGLEVVRRYERLCVLMTALVAPQLPPAIPLSSVELSVPLLPLLHVLCSALGLEPYVSTGLSTAETTLTPSAALFVLPSLYDSSLRLLDSLLRHSHHAMLPFVYPLSALLVDMHRRCNSTPSLESLLPAIYRTFAALFLMPLSPSLLAALSGSFLSSLLLHVQQPFVLRRELATQHASQSMASQLKPALAHSRRGAAASAASSAASELVREQQALREEIATAALLCLHSMLEAGSLLPLPARTTIDSTLLLLAMSLASSTAASSSPPPATIRLPLYRCLVAALMHPPAASPSAFASPLLPYALPVLARGARTGGEEGSVCRDGLLLCDWLTRERAGVTSGKRRKADRLFDRKEGDEDDEVHLLDGLDEWGAPQGRAAVGVEQVGEKRQRAADAGEWEERKDASRSFASGAAGAVRSVNGLRSAPERHQESVDMEEAEDASVLGEAAQVVQTELKDEASGETTGQSDEEEEEEEDEQDEQVQSAGEAQGQVEIELREEKELGTNVNERATETSSSGFSGGVDAADDDFGAVLYVDDDDEG